MKKINFIKPYCSNFTMNFYTLFIHVLMLKITTAEKMKTKAKEVSSRKDQKK